MEDLEDIKRSERSSPESTTLNWSNRERVLPRYESNEISLDTQGSENPMNGCKVNKSSAKHSTTNN